VTSLLLCVTSMCCILCYWPTNGVSGQLGKRDAVHEMNKAQPLWYLSMLLHTSASGSTIRCVSCYPLCVDQDKHALHSVCADSKRSRHSCCVHAMVG
jgi:hypothetical protein